MSKRSQRTSNFTYRQSQAMTTIEVIALIAIGSLLWFTGSPAAALVMLVWASAALLAHFNRRYKDGE